MLKVCESDQISFLDEVAAGAQTIELVEQVVVEGNSIIGVVFLFDHMRCAL